MIEEIKSPQYMIHKCREYVGYKLKYFQYFEMSNIKQKFENQIKSCTKVWGPVVQFTHVAIHVLEWPIYSMAIGEIIEERGEREWRVHIVQLARKS